MAGVELRRLAKSYGAQQIVKGIDLEVRDRELVVLVGPSGCGKSTTLRMVAGLESVSGGQILIGGQVVNALPPRARDVAMVFQDYALYPHKTVFDNMAFGLKVRGLPAAEIRPRVAEAAATLGIAHLLDRMPRELSGGQRQRVAMGRAIVRRPKLFLFDEPLSNLDAKLRLQVRTEIKKLHRAIGTTMIYVTHDQVEAMTLADRMVILRGGEIEQVGTPDEIYTSPRSIFVGGFVGAPAMNFARARVSADGAALAFADGNRLPLGPELARRAGSYRERELVVGIRPEHFVTGDASAPRLTCKVQVVEPLGADTLIALGLGEEEVMARLPPHVRPQPGTLVEIGVDHRQLRLFDPETERTLH